MKYGNCFLYAIPRFIREGGCIDIRWSTRNKYIPHVCWSGDGKTYYEFVPEKPRQGISAIFFAWIFKGKVQKKILNG